MPRNESKRGSGKKFEWKNIWVKVNLHILKKIDLNRIFGSLFDSPSRFKKLDLISLTQKENKICANI